MRRRRLLLGAGLLAIAGLAGLLVALLIPRPGDGITEANFGRLRQGMTESEVETVFGCPPGNYGGKAPQFLDVTQEMYKAVELYLRLPGDPDRWAPFTRQEPPVCKLWVGRELAVLVVFRGGKLEERWHEESVADQPEAILNRLRAWLGW
jgi:hypothetical protein